MLNTAYAPQEKCVCDTMPFNKPFYHKILGQQSAHNLEPAIERNSSQSVMT